MADVQNHPLRYALSNELHARPFPQVDAPSLVGYIAFTDTQGGDTHYQYLSALLERFGAMPVQPDATHHFCDLGSAMLKWEKHTEFVTYTVIKPVSDAPDFTDAGYALFPADWLAGIEEQVLTTASVILQKSDSSKAVEQSARKFLGNHFVTESLSISYVLDKTAVIATDFRVDNSDHIRFAIFPIGQVGRNRLGRILQRVLEIETYKSMAMLTLPVARSVFAQLEELEAQLSKAVTGLSDEDGSSQDALETLLLIAARIENLTSRHAYRFSAASAYWALVDQRIEVLREERFVGRQTFGEFMMRRFHPAMRTCAAASERLTDISRRAARASDLLSTRVSVRQNSQNRQLLAQMDERADVQLRLQETVEGLSIVAISYYAVSLLSYLLTPVATAFLNIDKMVVTSALVIPVVICVALAARRIHRRINKRG